MLFSARPYSRPLVLISRGIHAHDGTTAAPGDDAPARRTGPGFAPRACVQVTSVFTLMAISVPLPRIGAEFGLGRSGLVLLSSAYGLSFAGLLLVGGRLADRYGGRRTLTAGLLLFALSSLAVPLTPGFPLLLGLRFAEGGGAALTAPAAMAVLRVLLPAGAALSFAAATVLAVEDTPPHETGLAGGATNPAMELGPTVGLALPLGLGSPAAALAAAGACCAALAAATTAIRRPAGTARG